MNFTLGVFEEVKELGQCNDFPIFDEYLSEELEVDCVFEIEDECEDLPIFDEHPNEDFGRDLEGVSIFDEFPNGDIDDG